MNNTYSVMIIDDSEVDRYLLKRLIAKAKFAHKIYEEDDGASAMEFLSDYTSKRKLYKEDFPPIIIFLDINMPRLNGLEFLEEYKTLVDSAGGFYDASVILMFSSSENKQDREQALAYDNVKGYVEKMPEDENALSAQVFEALAAI